MLATLDALWPVHIPALSAGGPSLEDLEPQKLADRRIPARNPEIRGPLDVYYYSYLESAGPDAAAGAARLALGRREAAGAC